jgi:hypothetical protein
VSTYVERKVKKMTHTTHCLNELHGFKVHGSEGEVGKLREVLFDDRAWKVQYLVVDVRKRLRNRRVLLSPVVVDGIDWKAEAIHTHLGPEQLDAAPEISMDMPVVYQQRALRNPHYGWDMVWMGESLIGASHPNVTVGPVENVGGKPLDTHLRTTRVITGLKVSTTDAEDGRVSDFAFDDDWRITAIVVERFHGGTFLVDPNAVLDIDIDRRQMAV